jgi:GNAT superfamily N-acetyltransferase
MAANLSSAVTNPNNVFCQVVVHEEKIVGALFGHITEFLFGPDLIACDFGWYILPEYRGSRSAVKLLKNFEAWAEKNGAKEVAVGISMNVMPEKTAVLLQKLGYNHVGGNFKKAV